MEIYHGSNVPVEKPLIQTTGFYKDFGFGFYCTVFEKQAQRWALTHQIVFCTDKALQVVSFIKSYAL